MRTIRVHFAMLVIDPNARVGRAVFAKQLRIPAQRTKNSTVLVEGRFLAELLVAVNRIQADREGVWHQHVIVIERIPDGAETTNLGLNISAALKSGGVRAGVNDTGGTTQSKQNGVGTALEIDATNVEAVPRN